MAEDDGSEVAIESQFLIRWYDGQWRHYVYVCNKTDQVQDTWVETYPYETLRWRLRRRVRRWIDSLRA
ncbi:hypothetical protein [Salinigranum sp. GCM10025319]|uniref:hypothetical protein n=1 Tax=Salinigranum sp. GCM10025319 TaxID=3252687 RepID=UPI00360E882E